MALVIRNDGAQAVTIRLADPARLTEPGGGLITDVMIHAGEEQTLYASDGIIMTEAPHPIAPAEG
ncbi:hypothetical protein NDN01_10060 [Sphingomonas sp. QA11]|uniref:hypothetical protein n=1 Tax=Sphingomonas sp. QA11 TaxID=2950605 RepID=UPI00234A578D|nr:hypothetical protein [Sphingomonas sp. QA11]WCM29198.1 hypothetical protein NDN01_10060 [Sphingomonas sp. QA11]